MMNRAKYKTKQKKYSLKLPDLFIVVKSDHFISEHKEVEVTSC